MRPALPLAATVRARNVLTAVNVLPSATTVRVMTDSVMTVLAQIVRTAVNALPSVTTVRATTVPASAVNVQHSAQTVPPSVMTVPASAVNVLPSVTTDRVMTVLAQTVPASAVNVLPSVTTVRVTTVRAPSGHFVKSVHHAIAQPRPAVPIASRSTSRVGSQRTESPERAVDSKGFLDLR